LSGLAAAVQTQHGGYVELTNVGGKREAQEMRVNLKYGEEGQ
jgi:hypothetical protein